MSKGQIVIQVGDEVTGTLDDESIKGVVLGFTRIKCTDAAGNFTRGRPRTEVTVRYKVEGKGRAIKGVFPLSALKLSAPADPEVVEYEAESSAELVEA